VEVSDAPACPLEYGEIFPAILISIRIKGTEQNNIHGTAEFSLTAETPAGAGFTATCLDLSAVFALVVDADATDTEGMPCGF
jgi:hypothetical protein